MKFVEQFQARLQQPFLYSQGETQFSLGFTILVEQGFNLLGQVPFEFEHFPNRFASLFGGSCTIQAITTSKHRMFDFISQNLPNTPQVFPYGFHLCATRIKNSRSASRSLAAVDTLPA